MKSLTIILLFTILSFTIATKVLFSAEIYCPQPYWCVQYRIIDVDLYSEGEVGFVSWRCSPKRQRTIETKVLDMLIDQHHNFTVNVEHNCRRDLEHAKFEQHIGGLPEVQGTIPEFAYLPLNFSLKLG